MLKLLEIKKVEKLINDKGYIPFTIGNRIMLLFNQATGKTYKPKNEMYL